MEGLESSIVKVLRDEILSRVKELLEQKHLYQSVRVDISGAKEIIANIEKSDGLKRAKDKTQAALPVAHRGPVTKSNSFYKQLIKKRQQAMLNTIEVILGAFWNFHTDECTQRNCSSAPR